MQRNEPWYSCDTCDRIVGRGWQFLAPGAEGHTLHFCNNNCKGAYKGDKEDPAYYAAYVGGNFPTIKEVKVDQVVEPH